MSVPQTIIDEAACLAPSLLPEKSSARYEHEYAEFKKGQQENNVIGVMEDVVLAYINNLSKKFSPNSLWSKWSMVKSFLAVRENIDSRRFHKVVETRRFTITDDWCIFKPCAVYRKYAALRPQKSKNLWLFLTHRNGKCVALNADQHTLGGVPKKIAEYLGLQEHALYTGHSFRRTRATMVVDAGGDTLTLKCAGRWKSTQIAESYVDDLINNKIEMSKRLFPLEESAPSTSTEYASAL